MTEEKKELEVANFEEIPTDYTGIAVIRNEEEHDWGDNYSVKTERVTLENGIRNGITTITECGCNYDDDEDEYYNRVLSEENILYINGEVRNIKLEEDDVVKETPYVDGKIHGVVIIEDNRTFGGSHSSIETPYNHGVRQGIEKEYAPIGYDKILIRETPYVNGEKHGEEKEYSKYNFGKITRVAPYSRGKLNGIVMEDNLQGEKSYTQYKNGKKNGVEEKYVDGSLSMETTYADDKQISAKDYKKGTIIYNDGRVAKISEEEMKNPVGTLEKIAVAKKRLRKHFENPKENAKVTQEIREGMVLSTPIIKVEQDEDGRKNIVRDPRVLKTDKCERR